MVATVGSISIDLSTNAAKFADGFKSSATTVEQQSARMAKAVGTVEKGVNSVGATLKNFGAGLAAGAGLTAIASLSGAFDKLKETISEYDKIASDAKTTGLKTDTFQALAFAAKQANIEYDSFNSSLDIFAKNSGLAERGQGALYAGLKNLNPQLLQAILNTKDQEERLKLVSDAMANTSDATQRAALSTVIFGKGGIEMARILEQGRASIEKFKQSAREMGIIIPDELLQRAGELDDKLDLLSKVISVQLGQALINLAPILVGSIQGFADFSKELNNTAAVIDNFINNPSLANFAKIFGEGSIKNGLDGLAESSHRSTAAIQADIEQVQQTLDNLRKDAAVGLDVTVQTDRAQEDLKALQEELRRTSIAAQAAANNASGAFDEMLKSMGNIGAAAPKSLPTVTGYRSGTSGPPSVTQYGPGSSDLGLIDRSSRSDDTVVNGVRVRKYGGYQSNPANFLTEHTDQYGAKIFDSSKSTASYTQQTADNVSKLDSNTKDYLSSLSRDIGGYSQQQSIAISRLSQVVGASMQQLNSYALAALVHNNDSGATGTGKTMFGDSFDSQYGSYISSWGVGKTTRPSVKFPTTSSDGNYGTSVNVQQPGNPITFNYTAAPGVSNETAKQQALDMYYTMTTAAARA
ncbi:hypothetical protein EFV37_29165 [Mesorhizobium loti]|uniref:Uncharacterized protein n=1 Tax=Mesorhizobium jarvisii TaxID=1777867 RepID=A0A6M7TLG8_9HYPH|nr:MULTISPECIES: hypothetical protein [Mesorhizobium]OBQ68909.1 hypothetical protein A9K72_12015 [Mesorhizobium loti]QKC65874.1 hypothetical protein EB229_29155 [Mesorhizobium jarvisii]QKD11788.1 hypothetical protein EFV37_29165 [Mesorhizobium loti]RJT37894.1 hypothetical protein D3242_01210 [Mesorhizobium jarvisii]